MKVDIERILELKEELAKINRMNLKDISFFKNNDLLDIKPEIIEEFEFIGLNNVDFITSGYYRKPPRQSIKVG